MKTEQAQQQSTTTKGPAVVFGASGEQGRAVVEGLVDAGYAPVSGVTRSETCEYLDQLEGAQLVVADIASPRDVQRVLATTKASAIYVVTATDLPTDVTYGTGFHVSMEDEYTTLVGFFETLIQVYQQDQLERHVVLSTLDDVQTMAQDILDMTGKVWIEPLDDGSIVPHYSGKGRAGEEAAKMLEPIQGLFLTRLTLPFLHSNFLGFFVPLPDEGRTQWTISASFGEDSKIDMLSTSDLAYIVPQVLRDRDIYAGKNLRLSAEQLSMDEVAVTFADLFGKDVIYNPLTVQELRDLPFPAAPVMAQMCQFLGDPRSLAHDVELTKAVMYPRTPQQFSDWLLIHSDHEAFEKVGLSVDAPEILSVTVFGATSLQGTSVVKGLLADERKTYTIRATTRHVEGGSAKALKALDPKRVELVYAEYDTPESCRKAVDGVDGAFLVTDLLEGAAEYDSEREERHIKNIIDACEASHSVRHLVFSSMASAEEMSRILSTSDHEHHHSHGEKMALDARARAVAYARTKRLSVTYVLMPVYAEWFLDLLRPHRQGGAEGSDGTEKEERMVMAVPMKDDTQLMCMSVEDLGPAVANIFDSYQVYAGHEIGLVTDFVTVSQVADMLTEVMEKEEGDQSAPEREHVEKEEWIEARDSYMKDLGQMFRYMSHTEEVRKRHSIAKTMALVPTARPLRKWIDENKDNPEFREKLGLR